MSLLDIAQLVFDRIENSVDLPTGKSWPNLPYKPSSSEQSFVAVDMLPAVTSKTTISHDGYYIEQGLVQVTVVTKAGANMLVPLSIADDIQALFPVGLKVSNVEFNQPASVSTGFPNGQGWYQLPVSIPYTLIVQ